MAVLNDGDGGSLAVQRTVKQAVSLQKNIRRLKRRITAGDAVSLVEWVYIHQSLDDLKAMLTDCIDAGDLDEASR
jgi:hypothetical protein